jgi:hypothetical protein
MKKLLIGLLCSIATFALILTLDGCDGKQSQIVSIDTGEGTKATGNTVRDTVYIDCPPCNPDTVYGDCPECPPCNPDTVHGDCPPCPADSPYEGIFYITSLQSTDFVENCMYSFVTTSYQLVAIEEEMICFAGWMVDWDEASKRGGNEWSDHTEADGIFYDSNISFEIYFSDTDHLSVTLTYHIEAGYIGYTASYICDDEFKMNAERASLTSSAVELMKQSLPKIKLD